MKEIYHVGETRDLGPLGNHEVIPFSQLPPEDRNQATARGRAKIEMDEYGNWLSHDSPMYTSIHLARRDRETGQIVGDDEHIVSKGGVAVALAKYTVEGFVAFLVQEEEATVMRGEDMGGEMVEHPQFERLVTEKCLTEHVEPTDKNWKASVVRGLREEQGLKIKEDDVLNLGEGEIVHGYPGPLGRYALVFVNSMPTGEQSLESYEDIKGGKKQIWREHQVAAETTYPLHQPTEIVFKRASNFINRLNALDMSQEDLHAFSPHYDEEQTQFEPVPVVFDSSQLVPRQRRKRIKPGEGHVVFHVPDAIKPKKRWKWNPRPHNAPQLIDLSSSEGLLRNKVA